MVHPLTKTIGDFNEFEKARQKRRTNPDAFVVLEVDIAADHEQEVKPVYYYTIPTAAELTKVNPSTLLWAANNDKLPYQVVNPGTDNEFKVVTLDAVNIWNQNRDTSKPRGGRPKTKK